MKIFLSYGHDGNTPLIQAIKDYLSHQENGSSLHEVWIDTSEIKEGDDWRQSITSAILGSDAVLAGLSKYSTRDPGVCRDEILISVGVKGGNIKTVLLEPSDQVCPPAMLSHIQWLDMSDWRQHQDEGFDSEYFLEKFKKLRNMLETPENISFDGEITMLKKYLEPISSISRIKALTSKKMYGREWVYDKIMEWDRNSDSRIFWIMAGPGFGKSMFAAHLSQMFNAYIPAVQFVEWGKPDHSDPRKILCNIAFYLAVRFPDYRKFLLASSHVLVNLKKMNEYELFDFFFCESTWMQIDGGRQNVWILIDALDEANDGYGNKIAQTLSRHVHRLPKWLRFIITSRRDKKVSLPLEGYNPQVCDLENIIQDNNRQDMMEYLKGELRDYNLSEDVYSALIEKSGNVFLYLNLLVEDFKKGLIDLNQVDKLPNGLGAYYYAFFSRMFGNDMDVFYDKVAPLLQVYTASETLLSYEELKYLLKLRSESQFYRTISLLDQLLVTKKDEEGRSRIAFFHNSIENWLTDYSASGQFFISREDGEEMIYERFVQWIQSDSSEWDKFWSEYRYTTQNFVKILERSKPSSLEINPERVQSIIIALHNNVSVNPNTPNNNVEYLVNWFERASEEKVLTALIIIYEGIIEGMIKIGVVSPTTRAYLGDDSIPFSGYAIAQAVRNTEVLGYIGIYIAKSKHKFPYDLLRWLIRIVERISFYDRRVSDVLPEKQGAGLEIFANNVARNLDDRNYPQSVTSFLRRKLSDDFVQNNESLEEKSFQEKPYTLFIRLEKEIFPEIFSLYEKQQNS